MAYCERCNRRIDHSRDKKTGKRRRTRDHVCPIVVIQKKEFDKVTQSHVTKTVHENRVAKGGDLYKLVTGKKAPWEVVYRNRQRIEKKIEEGRIRKAKKGEKQLVAPSGEPLTPPRG